MGEYNWFAGGDTGPTGEILAILKQSTALRALQIDAPIGDADAIWIGENLLDHVELLWLPVDIKVAGARALVSQPREHLRDLFFSDLGEDKAAVEILFGDRPSSHSRSPGAVGADPSVDMRRVISGSSLDGTRMRETCRFPRLEALRIGARWPSGINDNIGLLAPNHFPNLARLVIECQLEDDQYNNRMDSAELEIPLRFKDFRPLSAFQSLRTLTLVDCRISDDAAVHIAGLNITKLRLYHCSTSEEQCRSLARSTTLRSITLRLAPHICGRGIAAGPGLESLEELDLRACAVDDGGAMAIARRRFPNLKTLILNENPAISSAGATALAHGGLEALEVLCLSNCGVDDNGAMAIASGSLGGLKALALGSDEISDASITDVGVRALSMGNLRALRELVLRGSFAPTRARSAFEHNLPTLPTLCIAVEADEEGQDQAYLSTRLVGSPEGETIMRVERHLVDHQTLTSCLWWPFEHNSDLNTIVYRPCDDDMNPDKVLYFEM